MPARLSSMELSPASNPDGEETTRPSRRKSGRAVHAPERLVTSSAPKRKRDDVEDVSGEEEEDDADDTPEGEDDEPAEEEVREKTRKTKRASGAKATAPKRVKTTAGATKLASRPKTKAKTAKKGAKLDSASDVGGLYAEVFGEGKSLDDVCAQWLTRFGQHQANALTEIVNLILRATGSEREVEAFDIEDPDNCQARLTDIQEELQASKVADYPLIAKNKSAAVFKTTLISFFNSLIRSIAANDVLYNEAELIENIHIWVSTMSSASSRPFRHTATVIALAVLSALAEEGKKLVDARAQALRHAESESKKPRKNQKRIDEIQAVAQQKADLEIQLKGSIADWFDTVFLHRYRDVDPKVRTDCVSHLGEWIRIYPDHFFDGVHLRYLGWVLSDLSAQTRVEVVKQLQKIYKDETKVPGLRMFTERFRPRMVEMAARDADGSVRVAAIELLELLRAAGLLEPDDIDTISKLIYDTDARIRKAVVPFFLAGVDETFDSKIDDLGGRDTVEEALPVADEEETEQPSFAWLKLKSLAELLYSLNPEDDLPATIERGTGLEGDTLVAAGTESRCTLAAQAISTKMDELAKWEVIAGCLLFDHSQNGAGESTEDVRARFEKQCQLTDKEEVVLLDVLNTSVKTAIMDVAEATAEAAGTAKKPTKKLTKTQQQEQLETREAAAQRLAQLIPRLLKKFGASAEAASAVLRLEHVLNLEVFQELRQDSTIYNAMLDDINKQFLTHENRQVLFEASDALRHAKSFEELGEITESKLQALWDDTTHALVGLCKGEDVDVRGSIDATVLKKLQSTVLRIANLARISDCTQVLETPRTSGSNKQRRKQQSDSGVVPLDLLLDLVARGRLTNTSASQSQSVSQRNREIDATEDEVSENAAQCLVFYFMWRVSHLVSATKSIGEGSTSRPLDPASLQTLAQRFSIFTSNLDDVLTSRHGVDALRSAVAGTLLDIHCSFAMLKHVELPAHEVAEDDSNDTPAESIASLTAPMPSSRQKAITRVFAAMERDFAKHSGHQTEAYSGKDDPEEYYSDEPEDDPEDEDEEEVGPIEGDEEEHERRRYAAATKKQRSSLLAEQRLCMLTSRIILALRAGLFDGAPAAADVDDSVEGVAKQGPMYKRVTRNRARLGPNYKAIIDNLDTEDLENARPGAAGSKSRSKAKKPRKAATKKKLTATKFAQTKSKGKGKASKKSKEIISDDEDEDDEREPESEPEEEEEPQEPEQEEEDRAEDEEMPDVNGDAVEDEVESVLGD